VSNASRELSGTGSISISFPDNPQVTIVETDVTSASVHPVGILIKSGTEGRTFPSKHVLILAQQKNWRARETHYLKLDVVPSQTGMLRLWIRGMITSPGGQTIATRGSKLLDQQGFPVTQYKATVAALILEGVTGGRLIVESVPEAMTDEESGNLIMAVLPKLLSEKEYELVYKASLMYADVDGNGQEEVVMTVPVHREGIIAIIRKQDGEYAVWKRIDRPGAWEIKTFDLFGDGRQALIVPGSASGSGCYYGTVSIFLWNGKEFAEIWAGTTSSYEFVLSYTRYEVQARVQIVDLDGDGIREIVRKGVLHKGEWQHPFEKRSDSVVELEIASPRGEIGEPPPLNLLRGMERLIKDIYEPEWGYEAAYRFKETYFWNATSQKYEGTDVLGSLLKLSQTQEVRSSLKK
jgi:hypothetical protein